MTNVRIPRELRNFVRVRAQGRCEYCQTTESVSGVVHEVDHIRPRAEAGPTSAENLCLACASCNGRKLNKTHAFDPETGQLAPLYNPRTQVWQHHFAWSADGAMIIGLTAIGRASVHALAMNPFDCGCPQTVGHMGMASTQN